MYQVLAFYLFSPIKKPQVEVAKQKAYLADKDATSRIYISEEGINGQMSIATENAQAYIDWMHGQELFRDVVFKSQDHHEHVFPRLTIKVRKQLVALDLPVDLSLKGEHVSPQQWVEMLENQDKFLIDVRNEYEGLIGHFEGAEQPNFDEFRHFPKYVQELKKRIDPKTTPIMMYCTGGIRCELFSALMRQEGFEKVYQLSGGVLGYAKEMGSKHWLGKLFVFDDRLAVPLDEQQNRVIGKCHICNAANESYYNCANIDCNRLYLCCQDCLQQYQGCCQESCQTAPRVRPYHHQNAHKPFRKWYHYAKEKKDLWHLNKELHPGGPPGRPAIMPIASPHCEP